jgi:hypothetical protein
MKDKWPAQADAMIDGVTIAKAAKRCDVDYGVSLETMVEGDETSIFWNRSKASDRAFRAREAANRPSVGFPPNRSRSSWHEAPRMQCCQN